CAGNTDYHDYDLALYYFDYW
nr:immunoglobulin heavy chain junction region [Mus musculus]MBK4188124.1 immunoglobulin heavy chain junction region [Mus musculus]MBK4188125.1 immunoglobulin heavy chain junction region [Mus musculus]MBK4188126.1 immunoglobulin heavy chain junction region [Mus musculus]MBK4188127.1 immunoglobulin heavy chain junction region [Mus musculus]